MRQSYFRDREIKFSRLSPIDLEEGQTLGTMIAEETTRTWQYLDSLRHFGPDDRLEVCILIHKSDRPAIETALRDFAQLQYRLLDMDQVAAKLGLKHPPLGSTAEEVMVHLFHLRRAENHFASSELRRYSTQRRARIVLNQISIGVLAASIAWAGWSISRVFRTNEADTIAAQQLNALNREFDEITRSLPSFGVGGSTMRDAVTFYNYALRDFPTLASFVVPLSGALGAHPNVRLTQLSWQATDDLKAVTRIPSSASRNAPSVTAIASGPAAAGAAPADTKANPPFAGGRYEVALVEATVKAAQNDFRGAMNEVESLVADIAGVEGFRAEVVESPLDTSPGLAIQGKHGSSDPAMMEPRFVLKIVRERRGAA